MTIAVFILAWIILIGWAFIAIKNAPLGYEDEKGFHELGTTPYIPSDKKIAA